MIEFSKDDVVAMALIYEGVSQQGSSATIQNERKFASEIIVSGIQNGLIPAANLTVHSELLFRPLGPDEHKTYHTAELFKMLTTCVDNLKRKGLANQGPLKNFSGQAGTVNVGKIWYVILVVPE